jgi:hypothetical protein
LLFLCFGGTMFWTQDHRLATQVLYHLSHFTSPFYVGCFRDWVSWTVFPGLLRTEILPISASWVARITGVNHWNLVDLIWFVTHPAFPPKKNQTKPKQKTNHVFDSLHEISASVALVVLQPILGNTKKGLISFYLALIFWTSAVPSLELTSVVDRIATLFYFL